MVQKKGFLEGIKKEKEKKETNKKSQCLSLEVSILKWTKLMYSTLDIVSQIPFLEF